jgi:hypothetical protein
MSEVTIALVGLIVTAIGAVSSMVITLLPVFTARQRMKLELDRARLEVELEALRRHASDKAVLAVEDLSRGQDLHGVDKVAMAVKMADEGTPKNVPVKSADVRAAVVRMRASMPTAGIGGTAPLSAGALLQVISTEPPSAPAGATAVDLPRPPAVPFFTHLEDARTTRPEKGPPRR